MFRLGFLYLMTSAVALPYRGIIPPSPFTEYAPVVVDIPDENFKSEENKVYALLPSIPAAPQLEPLGGSFFIDVVNPDFYKDKDSEKSSKENGEEKLEDKDEKSNAEPILVKLEVLRPQYLSDILNSLQIPFSLPSFNLPFNLSSLFTRPKYVYSKVSPLYAYPFFVLDEPKVE